jgi:hypothetical protein
VELEIRRHDWPSLVSAYGNSSVLPEAVRDLRLAETRADAELAVRRLEQVLPLEEGPVEVAVAAASLLVHALWRCSTLSLDLVLGVLADLSAGFAEGDLLDQAQSAIRREILREVSRGFPMYVEIMEYADSNDSRTACIDLITVSGMADTSLGARAIYFLQAVLEIPEFLSYHEVVAASIADLRAV